MIPQTRSAPRRPAHPAPVTEAPRPRGAARLEAYVAAVLEGRERVGALERLACERHARDMARAADGWRYVFDPVRCDRVVRFIEELPHIKGEWASRREKLRLTPWQCFVVGSLFGWVDRVTGLRRFKTGYLEVGRKNAKSTLLSGVGLYCTAFDGEAGAEVVSAATTKEQARKIFDPAREMALRTRKIVESGVKVGAHKITHDRTASSFEALASQTNSLDGANPSCALIDELHAHDDRKVLEVITSGMGARSQPLLVIITTAGHNIGGVCFERRSDLINILKGTVEDETTFGVIYAVDSEEEAWDPANFRKANPNLGVSVKPEFLDEQMARAKRIPAEAGEFLRKHCCWWSSAGVAALDLARWRAAADPAMTLRDIKGLRGRAIAIDASKNDDLTSVVAMGWRDDAGGKPVLVAWDEHWATEDVAGGPGGEHLLGWHKQDWLHLCPGALIDMDLVEERLVQMIDAVDPDHVIYDPMYVGHLITRVEKRYGGRPMMVQQSQGTMALDPGLRQAQGLVREGRVVSRGNPVMEWMVGNARARPAGEFLKLRKDVSHEKIDGVQALCTGLAFMEVPETGANQITDEKILARGGFL